jgi:hypothetical protein
VDFCEFDIGEVCHENPEAVKIQQKYEVVSKIFRTGAAIYTAVVVA